MWTRIGLKNRSKEVFRGNYWKAVLAGLLLSLTIGGSYSRSGGGALSGFCNGILNYDVVSGRDTDIFGFHAGPGGIPGGMFGAWLMAAGIIFLVTLVIAVIAIVADVFLLNPLEVGVRRFFYTNLHQKAELREIMYGFDHSYKNVVKVMFFRDLYTFLWSLLFVIPGIVKTYSYAMTPYIMSEHPSLTANEAITESRRIMDGNKWRLFCLDFSFIGWELLCSLPLYAGGFLVLKYFTDSEAMALSLVLLLTIPLSIGFFFVRPYEEAAWATFYRDTTAAPTVPDEAS